MVPQHRRPEAGEARCRPHSCSGSVQEVTMNASNLVRMTAVIVLLGFAGVASAQAQGGEESRGSVAPGTAMDGTRPGDGAINGGSIVPGESGGMPKTAPAERDKRCNELSGTLRDDCLLKEQSSNTGPTKSPDSGGAKTAPSRDAPPPQNPR
jgi:hypothetical protein